MRSRAGWALVMLCVALAGCSSLDPGTSPRTSLSDGVEQSDALLKRLVVDDGPGCSAAVAMDGEIADAGKLRLGDSISQHLEGLPEWSRRVTVDELLHHTSGIPDYTSLLLDEGLEFEDETTQADALAAIGRADLQSPPGERYMYSNSNYVLLASIVESVTGEDFDAVVDREAFGDADLKVGDGAASSPCSECRPIARPPPSCRATPPTQRPSPPSTQAY